jgi:hypothetical protein
VYTAENAAGQRADSDRVMRVGRESFLWREQIHHRSIALRSVAREQWLKMAHAERALGVA